MKQQHLENMIRQNSPEERLDCAFELRGFHSVPARHIFLNAFLQHISPRDVSSRPFLRGMNLVNMILLSTQLENVRDTFLEDVFFFLTYVCFTFLLSLSATKKTRITLIKEFELVTSWCLIAVCNLQCRTSTPSMVWKKSTWQRHDSLEKDNFNRKACVIDEATCIDNLDLKKTSGTWIKRGNACTQPSASRKGCSKMFGCVIGKKARG